MATIKKLYFATGTDVTAPSDLSLESSTNSLSVYVDDAAFVAANGTAGEGDVYFNTTLKAPRAYISGAWRTGVMANDAADPTKTVGFDLTGSTTGTAQTLDFDNTVSRTYTFPNYAGRVVIQTGTETSPVLFPSATGNIDVGSATSTTRIVGNLEVQGTTTTLNTQTIQVEDNNMVLNFGGNDTTAQGSGLEVDRAGTHGSLVYDSAAATKWKAGNLGSEVELADISSAQALTNKTINAASNTISNITSAMLSGAMAPSKGGTGVVNNDAATLTRSGNHALTVTTTATTNVTLPTTGTLATRAGAEVLTNKDIDGGTASNTSRMTVPKAAKTTLDALTRKEGTILYGTDTKKHYTDDGITLNEMGGGAGGAAGRNYLQSWYTGLNPISSVTGLTTTGNRTSSQTLWGSSAVADFEAVNNVTSPLREGGDIKLDSKTTTINAFIETPMFSLDLVDLSKAIVLSFDVTGNSADGNYDVVVIRYNSAGTYQETISVAGNASSGTPASAKLPTGTTTFKGFFIAGSTASDLYSVRFRKLLAVNNDVQIDSLFVGPQSLGTGAVVTSPISYTPTTQGLGTISSVDISWWREGEYLCADGRLDLGTLTASEARLGLPSGLTTATQTQNNRIAGNWIENIGIANNDKWGWIISSSGLSYVRFSLGGDFQGTSSPFSTINGNAGLSSNATMVVNFKVKIAEWTSNVTMADRQVEEYAWNSDTTATASVTASGFGNGNSGVAIGSNWAAGTTYIRRVRFQNAGTDTDVYFLEWFDSSAGGFTTGLYPSIAQSTSRYGAQISRVPGSSTDVDVQFNAQGRHPDGLYGATGSSWSSIAGTKWRVKRVSAGGQVGYPVSARNIVGDTSGTAVPTGLIGERISDLSTSAPSYTASTYAQIRTVTLTAGFWRVSGMINMANGGTAGVLTAIISNANNGTEGFENTDSGGGAIGGGFSQSHVTTTSADVNVSTERYYLVPQGSTTTIYLVGRSTCASGTWSGRSKLIAIRIA
jgi:hypothetical protein